MKSTFATIRTVLLAGLVAVSACAPDADTTVAPAAPRDGLLSGVVGTLGGVVGGVVNTVTSLVSVPVVQRNVALANDVTVTKTIGAAGGVISVPQADLTITFAPGAVTTSTEITVTAYKGRALAYGFGPHGTVFKAPVTFTVGLSNTDAYRAPELASQLRGAYTPHGLLDLDALGNALVSELNAVVATLGPKGATVEKASFNVPHFSGYILAGGRTTKSTAK